METLKKLSLRTFFYFTFFLLLYVFLVFYATKIDVGNYYANITLKTVIISFLTVSLLFDKSIYFLNHFLTCCTIKLKKKTTYQKIFIRELMNEMRENVRKDYFYFVNMNKITEEELVLYNIILADPFDKYSVIQKIDSLDFIDNIDRNKNIYLMSFIALTLNKIDF